MATFLTHPLFGAAAATALTRNLPGPKAPSGRKFVILSTLCQWLPDLDTCAYLLPIAEHHPFGHRGLMHSPVFAFALALIVMHYAYRAIKPGTAHWWRLTAWFFLVTAAHGLFDALVADSLGVAFFWPLSPTRYLLPWQPLLDVPITAAAVLTTTFWRAVLIECQFFSVLMAGLLPTILSKV